MVVLGILLIVLGSLAVVAAIFVSEGSGELLGIDMSALGIFLVGVVAGALILWGISLLKWGTRRGLERRRERKELSRLNEKLDRVEAEQRRDDHDDRTT